jgi:hypothetical protein
VKKVYDNLDFGRGVEAFMAGMPVASVYALCEGLARPASSRTRASTPRPASVSSRPAQDRTTFNPSKTTMMRFYTPTAPLFEETWKLSDIELVK